MFFDPFPNQYQPEDEKGIKIILHGPTSNHPCPTFGIIRWSTFSQWVSEWGKLLLHPFSSILMGALVGESVCEWHQYRRHIDLVGNGWESFEFVGWTSWSNSCRQLRAPSTTHHRASLRQNIHHHTMANNSFKLVTEVDNRLCHSHQLKAVVRQLSSIHHPPCQPPSKHSPQ